MAERSDLVLGLKAEQGDVLRVLDKMAASLEKLEKRLDGVKEEGKKTAKTLGDKLGDATKKVGKGLQDFSKKVMKAGVLMGAAGLTGAIYKSIAAASRFETKMAEVSTLLGSKAGPKMEKFNKAVRQLAKESSASANELASGLYQVISAGTKGTEEAAGAMNLLETANRVAVAGVSDTFSAVDVLTTALNAYGQSAEESAKFSDVLFTTVKLGKINFQQLSSSIGMVTSAAAGAGVSFEEVNAAIAAMTALGVPAERAITGMNGIIRVAAKGTKELDAAIKAKLGTTTSDILETKGLTGVLEALQEVTGGSVIAMQKLGIEQEAIQGLSVLAGTGIDKFKTSLQEMKNAAGATDEAYKQMAKTFEFQSKKFRNVVNDVFIEIGNQILPFLIKKMEAISEWVQDHEDDIKEFVVAATEAVIEFGEFIIDNGATIAKLFVAIWLTSLGPIGQVAAAIGVVIEGLRQLFEWMGPGGKGQAMIAGLQALGIIKGPARDVRTEKDFEWDEDEELGGISGAELFGFKKPPKTKKPFKKPPKPEKGVMRQRAEGGPAWVGAIQSAIGEAFVRGSRAASLGVAEDIYREHRKSLIETADEFAANASMEWLHGIGGAELETIEERRAYAFMEAQAKSGFWSKVATGFAESLGEKLLNVLESVMSAVFKPYEQIMNLFGMAMGGATVEDVKAQTEQMVQFWEALAENLGPVLDYLIDEGIPMILDAFIEHIPDIIDTLAAHVPDLIKVIIQHIPEIIAALAEGVARALEELLTFGGGGGFDIAEKWGKEVPVLGHIAGGIVDIGEGLGDFLGLWHTGGYVSKFADNVIDFRKAVRAHQGLFVRPNLAGDEMPAILQMGEGVIRKEVTAAMGGKPWVDAMNSGRVGGGDTHVHLHTEHMYARDASEVIDNMQAEMVRRGAGRLRKVIGAGEVPGFKSRRR